jgi:hypothetical protein
MQQRQVLDRHEINICRLERFIIPGKTKLVTETQKRRRSLSTTDAVDIFSYKTSNGYELSLLGLVARLDLLKKSMDVLSFIRKAPVAYLVPVRYPIY